MFKKYKVIIITNLSVLSIILISFSMLTYAEKDAIIYRWDKDEPKTDGTAENILSVLGDFTDNRTVDSYWIINPQHTGTINFISGSFQNVLGDLGEDQFYIDIYIGRTDKDNLTLNSTLNYDMIDNIVKVVDGRLAKSNQQAGDSFYVEFDTNYKLISGQKYIVSWIVKQSNSIDGENDLLIISVDGNTTNDQYRRVFSDGAVQTFGYIGSITLGYKYSLADNIGNSVNTWIPIIVLLVMIGNVMAILGISFLKEKR